MENKTIVKICITLAALGLIALYFVTNFYNEKVIDIADAKNYVGQNVRIKGYINTLYTSQEGHSFLKVYDISGDIEVVAFKSSKIDVSGLQEGKKVSVFGRVQEYKGSIEIIAKEIKVLSF